MNVTPESIMVISLFLILNMFMWASWRIKMRRVGRGKDGRFVKR